MDISIIIVSFNTQDLLKACLDSLFSTVKGVAFEVIAVDNHSGDGTREMLGQCFPTVRCFFNEENKGFSAANNQGAAAASGSYLFFLNSDTVVRGDAVQELFARTTRNGYGAVGPKLIGSDGKVQLMCARNFPSLAGTFYNMFLMERLFPANPVFGKNLMGDWDHLDNRVVDSLSGAAIMVERELFHKIGGFDEEYIFYSEDIDLCRKIRRAGREIFYCADAEIIHYGGGSSKAEKKGARFYEVILFNSSRLYFMKNAPGIRFFMFNVIAMAAAMLRMALVLVVGPFCQFNPDSDFGMETFRKYWMIFLLSSGLKRINAYEEKFRSH